jgi:hypothetical protein
MTVAISIALLSHPFFLLLPVRTDNFPRRQIYIVSTHHEINGCRGMEEKYEDKKSIRKNKEKSGEIIRR